MIGISAQAERNALETISARELREILFHISDDKMTVKELRAKLFDVQDQDKQIAIDFSMDSKLNLR